MGIGLKERLGTDLKGEVLQLFKDMVPTRPDQDILVVKGFILFWIDDVHQAGQIGKFLFQLVEDSVNHCFIKLNREDHHYLPKRTCANNQVSHQPFIGPVIVKGNFLLQCQIPQEVSDRVDRITHQVAGLDGNYLVKTAGYMKANCICVFDGLFGGCFMIQ